MRHVVGVGDMKLSSTPGDLIVTHALGSCIGVAIHDPVAHVGGILHFMLPTSSVNPEKAQANPHIFADSGIPALFKSALQMGAARPSMVVKVAGGAQVFEDKDFFAIGKRNQAAARKIFGQNRLPIDTEHTGGHASRTLYLEVGSGRTWLTIRGREVEL